MLNIHLSLAVNQNMWEAVLTFNHLTQFHIIYIKSHQAPAKTDTETSPLCSGNTY